ncbi:MAG: gliding motility-associated C-terminal domain-containing protein [Bacteroidetes bacterium]|nr:gliding motility-associated C-terminal domain-containing protein [Bacteroidota bacterium]
MQQIIKTSLKGFLLLGTICLLHVESAEAQVSASRKYRVLAYKAGQPQVFSISNEVDIVPAISFYIPNTFTPNGDGMNDTFGIAGEGVQDFKMQIFNRWGQMIYESANANDRWDGTFQGVKVAMGTYIYKVSAAGPTGQRQNKEGNVNVIL